MAIHRGRVPDFFHFCVVARSYLAYIATSSQFQEEIDILEKVRQHPHFNIVHYHGIKVEGDIVTALVLGKLEIDLTEAQLSPTQTRHLYDPDLLIDDIRRGMEHLHSIGIMHVSRKHFSASRASLTALLGVLW